ncbi:hypothetical protein AWV79_20120 [Cupriavidus sp. UYMMa02A]|nr:hypothetical protein AWV79_20120 [Cupriavidus sp. UYMMa02A]
MAETVSPDFALHSGEILDRFACHAEMLLHITPGPFADLGLVELGRIEHVAEVGQVAVAVEVGRIGLLAERLLRIDPARGAVAQWIDLGRRAESRLHGRLRRADQLAAFVDGHQGGAGRQQRDACRQGHTAAGAQQGLVHDCLGSSQYG